MARTKQTELAVLCVLGLHPMTGYAVRAAIRDQLGFFWSESFGQIYPTLSELVNQGAIEKREGPRAGSSTFALTSLGRERLASMLAEPDQPIPRRNGLLLRLFFGRALGPEACRALLERTRDEARALLETYRAVRAEIEADPEYPEHKAYWLITVSSGEHTARATVAWAEESLALLESNRDAFLLSTGTETT